MKLLPSFLLSAALVAGLVAVGAMPANAHDGLVESTPAAGETLTALPGAFSVTMNEELLDLGDEGSGFGLLVRDAAGLYYGDGCVSVEGPTLSAAATIGEPGEYTLIWQVVSSDGHPTSDEFTFEWAPEDDFTAATGSEEPGDCNGQYVRDAPSEDLDPLPWVVGIAVGLIVGTTALIVYFRLRKK